jgi:hypothetical protein
MVVLEVAKREDCLYVVVQLLRHHLRGSCGVASAGFPTCDISSGKNNRISRVYYGCGQKNKECRHHAVNPA